MRQGCILSPLLYVLVSEVLAVNIRRNQRISALCLPGSSMRSPISQYADDTSLILISDNAIKAVFESYAMFEKASGSPLNQSKSKGLWLGGWSGRSDPPVDFDWTSTKIKVLGVFIGQVQVLLKRITCALELMSNWIASLSLGVPVFCLFVARLL